MKKKILAVFLVMLIIFTAACGAKDKQADLNEQEKYNVFMNDFLNDLVDFNSFDTKYTFIDPAKAGVKKNPLNLFGGGEDYFDKLDKRLATLKTFDKSQLDTKSADQIEIMVDILESEIKINDEKFYYFHNFDLGSSLGKQAQFPFMLTDLPMENKKDLSDYFLVLEGAEYAFKEYASFEKERQENGAGLSQNTIDKVIDQCEIFINDGRPFTVDVMNQKIDTLPDLSDKDKEKAKEKNEKLSAEKLVKAYEDLIDELSTIEAEKEDKGLAHFTNGKEYYAELLKHNTGLNLSPQQAMEILRNRFDQKESSIKNTYQKLFDQGWDNEKIENEKKKIANFNNSKEAIDFLIEKSKIDLPDIGDVKYRISLVPQDLTDNTSPASYMSVPLDANKDYESSIWFTQEFQGEDYRTVAHESFPGHMFEDLYHNRQGNPYAFNIVSDFVIGYKEGWAIYSEGLSIEYLPNNKQIAKLLHEQIEADFLFECMVDIGVHYEGWDKAELKKFLENDIGGKLSEEDLTALFEETIEHPTNANYYYLSAIKFDEMKTNAKNRLGDSFDSVEYHKVLMDNSPSRLDLLEKRMNEYIESKLSKVSFELIADKAA